jgi:hypothetical protein
LEISTEIHEQKYVCSCCELVFLDLRLQRHIRRTLNLFGT